MIKLKVLLIVCILAITIAPVPPVRAAIDIDPISTTSVVQDDTIKITGDGVALGDTIMAYWDTVSAAYLLNITTSEPAGTYEIWIDVPPTVYGTHYIWIKDVETGQTVPSDPITVNPSIELDTNVGLPEDEVTLSGNGFAGEVEIFIHFQNLSDSYLNQTTSPSFVETDEDGAFTCTVDIPVLEYGSYVWLVQDNNGNEVNVSFSIGAVITLSIDEGSAGSIVEISGRGFSGSTLLDTPRFIEIGIPLQFVDENVVTSPAGTFTAEVIIPARRWVEFEEFVIIVNDGTFSAQADFWYIKTSSISCTPWFGVPGMEFTVQGGNFTHIAGTELEFSISGTTLSDSITVNANGDFSGTLRVPAVQFGQIHTLVAVDEYGLNASTDFLVNILTMLLSESEGTVDSNIQLTATGLRGQSDTYNITFGDILLASQVAYDSTALSTEFAVPDLSPGTYPVTLIDGGWDYEATVNFTVLGSSSVFKPVIIKSRVQGGTQLRSIVYVDMVPMRTPKRLRVENGTHKFLAKKVLTRGPSMYRFSRWEYGSGVVVSYRRWVSIDVQRGMRLIAVYESYQV